MRDRISYDEKVDPELPWDESGGFGGHSAVGTKDGVTRTPIIFVHGNSGSHNHWIKHIKYFKERGYLGDELWAINIPDDELTHKAYAEYLDRFVKQVFEYTDRDYASFVTHSLGVTSTRYWMKEYDKYDKVKNFVGIAGANHGIPGSPPASFSRHMSDDSVARPIEFLSPISREDDYHYTALNENTETPGDIDYYTIRGSRDKLFTLNKDSPRLEGAIVNAELNTGHFGAKDSQVSKELIYQWCSS